MGNQPYLGHLYKALFSTAYFGLFQVGELTTGSHPVMVKDVHVGRNKRKIFKIFCTSETHGEYSHLKSIKLTSTQIHWTKNYETKITRFWLTLQSIALILFSENTLLTGHLMFLQKNLSLYSVITL